MTSKDKIRFNYLSPRFYFPDRTGTKRALLSLFKVEGFAVDQVNYIFCMDKYLLDINRRFLNHDTYTDIITFPYSGVKEPLLSDIYISVERVKENAQEFQAPFINELRRVMIHGALHLCGYKDKSKAEVRLMREKEAYYLKRMFHVK